MADVKLEAVDVAIENLSLAYDASNVLNDVNLTIKAGELFTFLGPSGSGKSTLLRAIAGFGPQPKGKILIGGIDVSKMAPWARNVGMVFQSYALWPHMSVRKNIAFGLEERKVPAEEIKHRVNAALNLVDLSEYGDRRPSQLSGGQQQRVALARTIVVEPRVLLLDEPLSNLDASLRNQMRRYILELQRKLRLTTIFVTHDQEEANTISDRIAVLNQGIIQQVGRPIDLYDKPTNRFVASFLGTANLLEGRVKKDNGEMVFESTGNLQIPLLADKNEIDANRIAMFRPQDVEIASSGEKISNTDAAIFDGAISHREFLGNRVRYSVDVKEHVIVVDDSYSAGRRIFEFGQKVVLGLDLRQVRMLAE